MRHSLVLWAVLFGVIVPLRVAALSITATASGSLTPPTAPAGSEIVNGDFQITDTGGGSPISGDGWNEITDWSFDFTSDPDLASFLADSVLQSAALTLTLFVGGPEPSTDIFELGALGIVSHAAFTSLAEGTTATVDIELLAFYSSTSIVSSLLSGGGVTAASYSDDAIVSFASLELTVIPEPSAMLLLATGLIGLAWRVRRG